MQNKAQGIVDRVLASQNEYKQAVLTKVNNTLANITLGDKKSFNVPLTERQSAIFQTKQPVQIKQTDQKLDIKLGQDLKHSVKLTNPQRAEIALTSIKSALKHAPTGELVAGNKNNAGQITFNYQNNVYTLKSTQIGPAAPINLLISSNANQLQVTSITSTPEQWVTPEKIKITNGQLEYKGQLYKVPSNLLTLGHGEFKISTSQPQQGRQITVLHNQQQIPVTLIPIISESSTTEQNDKSAFKLVSSQYVPLDKKIHIQLNQQTLTIDYAGQENNDKKKSAIDNLMQSGSESRSDKNKLVYTPPIASIKLSQNELTLKIAIGNKIETIAVPTNKLVDNKTVQNISQAFIQKLSVLNEGLVKLSNLDNKNAFEALFKAAGIQLPTGFNAEPSFKDNLKQLSLIKKNSVNISIAIPSALKAQLTELGIIKTLSPSTENTSASSDISIQALQKSIAKLQPEQNKAQVLNKIDNILKQPTNQAINIAESLNQLTDALKQIKGDNKPKQITHNALNQLQATKTAIDIQQIISSHLTSQHILSNVSNNTTPLNQLALALQVILTGKAASSKLNKPQSKTGKESNTNAIKHDSLLNTPKQSASTNTTNTPSTKLFTAVFDNKQTRPAKVNHDKLPKSAIEPLTSALSKTIKSQQINQLKSAQSQIKEQNNLYFQLPIMVDGEFKSIDLAINYEIDKDKKDQQSEETANTTLVRFSLKFNMGDMGSMLAKASLADNELKLSLYTDNLQTLKTCENEINRLREELSKQAIQLTDTQFKQGKIPQHLWNETAIGIQYRV